MASRSKAVDSIGKHFGLWEVVQVGNLYAPELKVKCLCRGCNQYSDVRLSNLEAGISKGCRSCRARPSKQKPVKCLDSGLVYASLKEAAAAENVSCSSLRVAARGAAIGQVVELRSGHRFQLVQKQGD